MREDKSTSRKNRIELEDRCERKNRRRRRRGMRPEEDERRGKVCFLLMLVAPGKKYTSI